MPPKSVTMAWFLSSNVEGFDVPEEIISRMENDGVSGIEIIGLHSIFWYCFISSKK
jgi:homocysteine S-methyltransferase